MAWVAAVECEKCVVRFAIFEILVVGRGVPMVGDGFEAAWSRCSDRV